MTAVQPIDIAQQRPGLVCRRGSADHILFEMKRLDGLIRARVDQARQVRDEKEEYRGLFISEREVDGLLNSDFGGLVSISQEAGSAGGERVCLTACECRLSELKRLFELRDFDIDCVLICLAPELEIGYERLYSYLQDDVTKRRPSVDLVLKLLCRTLPEELASRHRLQGPAPLIRSRILQLFEDPNHPEPTFRGKFLKLDSRVADYLLNSDELDTRIANCTMRFEKPMQDKDLLTRPEDRRRLQSLVFGKHASGVILYLEGTQSGDGRCAAEEFCGCLETGLLVVEGRKLAAGPEADFQLLLDLIFREAVLQSSALYWADFEVLLSEDKGALLAMFLRALAKRNGVSFLSGASAWEPAGELSGALFLRTQIVRPTQADRIRLWTRAIGQSEELQLSSLASKFRFSAAQIQNAAITAGNLARWRDPEDSKVTEGDLYEACRLQCNRKLSTLAKKITPHYEWGDIILPADRVQQLREICNSLKYRSVVYEDWGFGRKLALGKGLNVLFAGPPGTGKTMAADIIAGELGLDLYKTDLSMIVSKYIGETEKSLSRIFSEAETSNAILFFDEADALFGKRSEVRDSHDRYANIETNYLLQKLEEHEGVVILATNFRKNMDEAFVRRIHFTIDFPFPDEVDRSRIWETIWPVETPRDPDLDTSSLARRFEITGGNIRNIALAAGFLAADNGGMVKMRHLLYAIRKEYLKMGKVVSHGEFE